jgi:hypothetical protein
MCPPSTATRGPAGSPGLLCGEGSAERAEWIATKGDKLSKRSVFIALVVAAMVGALALASVAGARARADTRVTIHGENGDFHGKIFSDRGRCLGDRKVIVYKQKGDRQDPSVDLKIATDTSERVDDHGEWSVGNTGRKNGDFYAKVKRTDDCKPDRSRTISL